MDKPENFAELLRNYTDLIDGALSTIRASGAGSNLTYKTTVKYGELLRDTWIHEYSILPSAIGIFNQIASSREWMVIGRKRAAARAVDKLNNCSFIDRTGVWHYGWEDFFSRLVNDWLIVGRCMFFSNKMANNDWTPFEYLDVTDMMPVRKNNITIWQYREPDTRKVRNIDQRNVFFTDNMRIGSTGAVLGSVYPIVPYASLDWLLRQHDTLSLDGRKIKDIILVKNGMGEAIQLGILQSMALAAGEDSSKHGVPIVELEDMQFGERQSIQDYFARLGLSEIPRDFKREDMEARYAREISAGIGLAIGQFWYDPRGTNRSLEQVQQERATLKGPSHCVRSLTRTINHSGLLGRTPATKAILTMEEETDNSSLLLKAQALNEYAEGMTKIFTLFSGGQTDENGQPIVSQFFKPEQWLSFFQQTNLMPPNTTLADIVAMEETTLQRTKDEVMEKGTIKMNLDGYIVERRYDYLTMVNGFKDATPQSITE